MGPMDLILGHITTSSLASAEDEPQRGVCMTGRFRM